MIKVKDEAKESSRRKIIRYILVALLSWYLTAWLFSPKIYLQVWWGIPLVIMVYFGFCYVLRKRSYDLLPAVSIPKKKFTVKHSLSS